MKKTFFLERQKEYLFRSKSPKSQGENHLDTKEDFPNTSYPKYIIYVSVVLSRIWHIFAYFMAPWCHKDLQKTDARFPYGTYGYNLLDADFYTF